MKPIEPLMHEHRLIERAIGLMDAEIASMQKDQSINPVAVDTIVDFIRTYADRTHHGKEEEILFRDLRKKAVSDEHARITSELTEEHRQARAMVRTIVGAKEKFISGDAAALSIIITCFQELSVFYPRHIEKEDRHFFLPIMKYFSAAEQAAMLAEFNEFDRRMIHEKYTRVVDAMAQTDRGADIPDSEYGAMQKDVRGHVAVCKVCGYVYDPATGDPEGNIPPGMPFLNIPDDWRCPVCGAPKNQFVIR